MQFQEWMSLKGNPQRFDCASCQGKYHKCLHHEKEIKLVAPDFDGQGRRTRIFQKAEDIENYIDEIADMAPGINGIELLLETAGGNVCPIPLFTDLSWELLKMHNVCKDKFPYPGGYFDQLGIYIEASGIINSEQAVLHKKRMKEIDGQKRS